MLISSRGGLIRLIENIKTRIKDYQENEEHIQIDFICPNFFILQSFIKNLNFHQKNNILGLEILKIIKDLKDKNSNVTLNIHSFNELNENIKLGNLKEQEQKYYLTSDYEITEPNKAYFNIYNYIHKNNPFMQFILLLKDTATKNSDDIQNLEDLFNHLDSDKIKKENFTTYKNEVILPLIEQIKESDFFNNTIKPELKQNFELFFDDLLEYIQKLIEDKNNEVLKIILKFIAGVTIAIVVFVAEISSVGLATSLVILGVELLFVSLGALDDYSDFSQRDYAKLLSPLVKFLASRYAMFITYLNTHLFTCALIINKKELIDLSAFSLYSAQDKSVISSNLAYVSLISEEINLENFFSENPTQKPLELLNNDFKSILYLNKNEDGSILKSLQKDIRNFNHLAYIESPRFNSSKLTEFFIQKNEDLRNKKEQNSTQMGKNYLIISNIPSKCNAGLTQALTQEIIGNEIQDNYRKQKNLIMI